MKKTIFKILGTGLVAASVFGFVSCGESIDYDARTDTVYSLDAPSVTAKAYPGVNYISWEPVTSAQGYKLYRVKDGVTSAARTLTSDVTCYADVASYDNILSDGKEYKYIVEAISDTDPAIRSVYVKNSKGSASVKAVIPTAGSKAISADPTGSGKDFIKKYYEKLVTKASENVKLSISDGYFYAEYPATAGFKYGITAVPKGQYAAEGDSVATTANIINYKEDYKAEAKVACSSASEVEILLTVASVSDLYESVVVNLGSLTPEVLKEYSKISSAIAYRKVSDINTVVVSWTPAKLGTTYDYSPVGNFKVYRSSAIDESWTALSAEVKEAVSPTNGIAPIYYITDTAEDNGYLYTYYIVHTNGTAFGTTVSADCYSRLGYTNTPTLSVTKYVDGTDGLKNNIKIVSAKNSKSQKQTLSLSYVKLEVTAGGAMGYERKLNFSDFTTLTLENNDGYGDSYINYIKNLAEGDYFVKLVASEEGLNDSVVTVTETVNSAEVDVDNLSVTYDDSTEKVTVKEGIAKDSKVDSIANYKYTLYKVETTTSTDYTDYVTVSTTKVSDVALTYGTDTTYCSQAIEAKKSTTAGVTTQFYVVKALASDSSVYAKVSE